MAALSLIASCRLSSWCHASTSLHGPFSFGPSTPTKAVFSSMTYFGLSQCQASAALHDLFIASKPRSIWALSSLVANTRHNHGCLWNTALLWSQKTLPRRFPLGDADLFLITTNFFVPANQHQLSQKSKDSSAVVLASC